MSSGTEKNPYNPAGWDQRLEQWLHHIAAHWLPLVVALFSVAALVLWPSQLPATHAKGLGFRAAFQPVGQAWDPQQARRALQTAEPVDRFLSLIHI